MTYLWAEFQSAKNIQKHTLEPLYAKTRSKKTEYSRSVQILKSGKLGHFEKAVVMQNDKK